MYMISASAPSPFLLRTQSPQESTTVLACELTGAFGENASDRVRVGSRSNPMEHLSTPLGEFNHSAPHWADAAGFARTLAWPSICNHEAIPETSLTIPFDIGQRQRQRQKQ
eukprot:CAMPEP_0114550618 /NCGR_PEP_ID=MMETSP0114-20121206/6166_1 /TAXON_ID=31324 /ORGANISM="Goniomonas sp, Strain m" /LENGTH=110 /DNA_ID=CAMNT_0001735397 /DNA_START=431 /DNA_END=764 /DNA_ORIENTATION=+